MAEFQSLNHPEAPDPPRALCVEDHRNITNDWAREDFKKRRAPFVVNGVPVSHNIRGCCIQDGCWCPSDVIWYNGRSYDQKPFIQGNLRTRPGNVMYFEGKLVPPFGPGKSISRFGPYRARGKPPQAQCFNETKYGIPLDPCCRSSRSDDTVPPYHNTRNQAFTSRGLPHGDTLGYFRFKPDKICDCRKAPVERLHECCTCEPGEYNPAQYRRDECPTRQCCC